MDVSECLPDHKLDRRMLRKCEVRQQGLAIYMKDNGAFEGGY